MSKRTCPDTSLGSCVITILSYKVCITNVDYLLRFVTNYLLGQESTTLEYNCIQPVSNSLLVSMLDFDGNTVIPPYDMRSGIDSIQTTLSVLKSGLVVVVSFGVSPDFQVISFLKNVKVRIFRTGTVFQKSKVRVFRKISSHHFKSINGTQTDLGEKSQNLHIMGTKFQFYISILCVF